MSKMFVFLLSFFVGSAYAAVPTEATNALTTLQTDAESLIGSAWPVVAAITVALILIGLFKKLARKAGS